MKRDARWFGNEIPQPTPIGLSLAWGKLKRAVRAVDGMDLDCIEYNQNYIGLFVHVYYGGHEMKFLISYNHLIECEPKWIQSQLRRMGDRVLARRGAKSRVLLKQYANRMKNRKNNAPNGTG